MDPTELARLPDHLRQRAAVAYRMPETDSYVIPIQHDELTTIIAALERAASEPVADECHPSHETRVSFDASSFDEVCVNCRATDIAGGGWGRLRYPCSATPPSPTPASPSLEQRDEAREALRRIAKLTPLNANARSADDLHASVKAIAETALANLGDQP